MVAVVNDDSVVSSEELIRRASEIHGESVRPVHD